MSRQCLVSRSAALVAVSLLVLSALPSVVRPAAARAPRSPGWEKTPRHFALLRPGAARPLRRFLDDVRRAGGHVAIVYPPDAAVIFGPPSVLEDPDVARRLSRATDRRLSAPELEALAPEVRLAARAWNASVAYDQLELSDLAGSGHDVVILPSREPSTAPSLPGDGPRARPYGAWDRDQSAYMLGSVTTGIWLLESPDAENDWSPEDEEKTIGGIQAGMESWVRRGGPMARLTFVFDVHTGVPMSADPLSDCANASKWMGEAVTGEGYASVTAYNNARRTFHDTDWAFSISVVDTPEGYGGFCAGAGTVAWAALGGPYVYMYRFSSWSFNSAAYYAAVPMHEVGHTFQATDEYDGVQSRSGYLNELDELSPSCVMYGNDTLNVCLGTRNQLGWRDTEANGVPDPVDVIPTAAAALQGDNPSLTPVLSYTGTTTVGLVPNQSPFGFYFPPHAISVDRLAGVEGRVDGGPWSSATPLDGAFDGYSEGFAWTSPSLADGLRLVEFRALTEFGAGTEPGVRDSVWVLVNTTDRHPLVQAPPDVSGDEGAEIVIDVLAWDPDGDPLSSLTADLSALPPEAAFSVSGDFTAGTLQWTPGYDDAGDYAVTFQAVNALDFTASTNIHVADANRPPVVAAPSEAYVAEGHLLEIPVSASDPDGEPVTSFTADVALLPVGNDGALALDGSGAAGLFTWTPTCLDAGTYEVGFVARNNFQGPDFSEGEARTTIHVANDCSNLITAIDDRVMMAGSPDSTEVYVLDLDLNPLSVSANLPPFATLETIYQFDGEFYGKIRFQPAVSDTGDYQADVIVTAGGATDLEHFVVHVMPAVTTGIDQLPWERVDVHATPHSVSIRWPAAGGAAGVSVDRTSDAETWETRVIGLEPAEGVYSFEDADVREGERYGYRIWTVSGGERRYSEALWVEVPGAEPIPAAPHVSRIAPNPTSGKVAVRFAVPVAGRASLDVLDVHGRRVCRLRSGGLARGWHTVEWNGRSDTGQHAPSGVYFVRLDSAAGTSTRRIVLVR